MNSHTNFYRLLEQIAGSLGARLVPKLRRFLVRHGQPPLPAELIEPLCNFLQLAVYEGLTEPQPAAISGYHDGYATTSPVASFRPNKLGIYDMAGNVSQWCEDFPAFAFAELMRVESLGPPSPWYLYGLYGQMRIR